MVNSDLNYSYIINKYISNSGNRDHKYLKGRFIQNIKDN
jgi:hypothetical protein